MPRPDAVAIPPETSTGASASELRAPTANDTATGETSAHESKTKPSHHPPAELPTQRGPAGLRFDFNHGARLKLPEGDWRVRLSDLETGNTLYETRIGSGSVGTAKRYYVRARIQVWSANEIVLTHDYDAAGRDVLIQFPVGTLGDTIAWFTYARRFQETQGCKLTCAMSDALIPLFAGAHPHIDFVTFDGIQPERYYATYNLGLFFDDAGNIQQPCDFRLVGLHRTAGYILGVDPTEEPPRLAIEDDTPPVAEPYVCIGVQSTTQCKYWNNPDGWREIVRFLKAAGYRVICIDRRAAHGHGLVWNHIPNGAEDETGDRPLLERARWLRHAAFFIGLSSGLSWLAWAAGTPVVLISGFTHPTNEFATPYRIINYHACNGCWNDPRVRFSHSDFLWCPRHADTPRQFECTRLITAEQVKQVISTIPQFRELLNGP
jgi:autotransporter strand-loop-strand O-heptosyltransferase